MPGSAREPGTIDMMLTSHIIVVVTTPPEILSVFGASRIVRPVWDDAITSRIFPSVPVTTRLTVPMVAPPLPFTVRPALRPGRVLGRTALRARALLGLARSIAVNEACMSPWLRPPMDPALPARAKPKRARARALVAELILSALLVFERTVALGAARTKAWSFTRALIPMGPGPAMPPRRIPGAPIAP
jgi:hypothetical protein